MKDENRNPLFDLQLFADGGDGVGVTAEGEGVTGADAMLQTGEETAPDAVVQTVDRNAEFERLIKTDYKDLYDARVQDTVQKRLKGQKETIDRFNALTPTLELLASKYGVEATDIEALTKAIDEDDSFFEEEALKRGMTVQELKERRKLESENAELKRQMQERETQENANRLYAQWMQQEQTTKAVYPSFDMQTELENPKFVELLRSNIDVKTAYEVLHKDEIIPAAMQFTAKTVEQKITNKIMANGARPTENGLSSQGAAVVKSDPSLLTKEERQKIIEKVRRGEKVRF